MLFFNKINLLINNIYFYLKNSIDLEKNRDTNVILKESLIQIRNNYYCVRYNFYIFLLRSLIERIEGINDIIYILKKINDFYQTEYNGLSTDEICVILVTCLKKYPLKDIELQKFSIFQQTYENEIGINGFASTLFWICCVQSILEIEIVRANNSIIKYDKSNCECCLYIYNTSD